MPPFRHAFALLIAFAALTVHTFAAPTVTTRVPNDGATVNALSSISVTFNEAVTGVDASDLLINNDAALAVSGSGVGPYVFTFTQPAPGVVNISWDFDHGIAGLGTGPYVPTTWSYTLLDTLAPTVAKIKSSVAGQDQDAIVPLPGSTVGTLTQVEVTFSENVIGVDAADLLVNGAPATGVTGSGAGPCIFTFAQPAAGAVNFQWAAAHGITDTVGNPFTGGAWSVTLSASGAGNLVINEFLAANALGLADENGEQSGWIEIYNNSATPVNLAGWALTHDPDTLGAWQFPSRTLGVGGYLVVFASGKDRKPTSGNLHTNFKLNANGDYLALVGPASPRVAVSQFPPNYNPPAVTEFPVQRYDFSYGLTTPGGSTLRYFSPPTPNATNSTATQLTGVAAKPQMSVGRGFFKDPFQLVMSCATLNATVRYTLDGSVPIAASAAYTAPITISTTTVLRAVAFAANTISSETATHSYIYLDQVFNQVPPPYDNPANGADNTNPPLPTVSNVPVASGGTQFPVAWGTNSNFTAGNTLVTNLVTANAIPADYGMRSSIYGDANKYDDTGAINAATGKTNMDRIKQGLRDLPILSVVMKNDDMFGPSGLYPNSTTKGPGSQKPCSIEMILPDGSTAFATSTGIQMHGNASRNPQNSPKHSFSLNFKGDYGASSLDYQLFADSPVSSLDDIILRADYNSSWTHWDGGNNEGGAGTVFGQRPRGTRTRDAYSKDLFRGMGRIAGHHRFVNLFINGLYWGTFDATEKESNKFAANYFGGDKSDYDVMEQGALKSGTQTAYNAMTAIASLGVNTNYEAMKQYLDVPEFIDYMLLHFYVGHQDWGDDMNKNWYAVRNAKTNGTFKYLPWDQENLLFDASIDRTAVTLPPSGLHTKLVANVQYKLDFADRVHKAMVAPDGALQPAAAITRWNKWKSILTNAIAGESARWGSYRLSVHQFSVAPYALYTWNSTWMAENTRLTGTYFPARTANVLTQLRNRGLYPTLNAPQFQDNTTSAVLASQRVNAGYLLKMALVSPPPGGTTSAGTIYYTTDGSDPRVYYDTAGQLTATAVAYSTPIAINASMTVKARALNGTVWSALNAATFTVGFTPSPVRITEIMHHPTNAMGGDSAEFIELQNTGSLDADLSGDYFEGVDYVFPNGFVLGAGDRLVLANNNAPATFAAQYPGVVVAGYFGDSLDNGGERLALHDPTGRILDSVDYDDENGWPTVADGGGYSLEIIDPLGDPDDPANWKASAVLKGTPGQVNSTPSTPAVELSEVLAENATVSLGGAFSDFIELHNTTAGTVDISGWSLNDGSSVIPPPRKCTFPAGTTIPAGGFLVILCDTGSGGGYLHAGFTLNGGPAGDHIQLYDGSAPPVRMDGVSWGNQIADLSIGKIAGVWQLDNATPGAANTAAATVAATGNLVLNEWLANQTLGTSDWLEIYNKHATLPVALKGLYFQTSTDLYQFSALAFLAPHKWLQLFCNGQPGANQLDFNLPTAGTTVSILDSGGVAVDAVTFGAQTQGVSQGRNPDGSATIATFTGSNSPGAANYVINYTGPVLNEVLAGNVTGAQAPWGTRADWVELFNASASPFDLSGMKLGATSNAATAWTFPAGTSIAAGGYLAVWCDAAQPASVSVSADMNTGFSLGDTSGGVYLFSPAGQFVNVVEYGFQIVDRSFGLSSGTMQLLASPTRAAVNSAAATLGSVTQLRINEWMALQTLPTATDWFELYNLDTNPVAMAGLYLTDDPSETGRTKFTIPALSFIDGHGWVKWEADNAPELGRNHVNFNVASDAEYLRLSNNNANISAIDTVSYGLQSANISQGRIPDGAPNIVAMIGSPTPGAKNVLLPAPSFTTDPSSQSVAQNTNVTFTAAASGSAPLTYQWQFNGTNIGGATDATLMLNGVTPDNEGNYICVATNTAGTATSHTATLIVMQTFAQWSASNGLSGDNADPSADPDGDGLSNLVEFFAHLNPNAAATAADRAALPQVDREPATGQPAYLILTYRLNAHITLTNVAYQIGTVLGTWSTVAPDVTENLAPDPVTGDPRFRVKFSVAPGDKTKFARLLLTP
jgi:hypothetical protein